MPAMMEALCGRDKRAPRYTRGVPSHHGRSTDMRTTLLVALTATLS